MNDNLPAGAQYDSRAPWNENKAQREFDKEFDDAIQLTRSELANELPELIWNILNDEGYSYDVREAVYSDLVFDAKKLWES